MIGDEQEWYAAQYDHTTAYEKSHELKLSPCYCESSYCGHEAVQCTNRATGAQMLYVGDVCDACAKRAAETGGANWVTAPFGTWNPGQE